MDSRLSKVDAACIAFDTATRRTWEIYEQEVLQAQSRHHPDDDAAIEADIETAEDKRDRAIHAAQLVRGKALAQLPPRQRA